MVFPTGSVSKPKSCSGFTLMEFMIVLTIGAVLAGIAFPIGQKLISKANILADQQKLKQLTMAYRLTLSETSNIGNDKESILKSLIEHGGANDLSLYSSNFSSKKKGKITEKNINEIQSDWVFLGEISIDTPTEIPVLYSRGLDGNGAWNAKPASVYGTDGGLIAFLDGRVVFCKNAKEVLVDYNTQEETTDISKAKPTEAQWIEIK